MAQLPQRRRSPLARTLTAFAARLPGALRRLLCCAPGRRAGAARGPARPAFHVARAAMLVLLGIAAPALLPATTQAQTEQTLVSNLDTSSPPSVTLEARREFAQQFRNGSDARAVLSQVEVHTRFANPSASRLVVSLWSSVSNAPGEQLATFANPSNLTTGGGVKTFTSPGPGALLLQPMTSYFVVFSFSDATRSDTFQLSSNSDTDETGLSDWTVADAPLSRSVGAAWGVSSASPAGIRLRGSLPTAPVVAGLAITSEPAYDYGNYNHAAGDVIQVTVTFSEAVTVQTTGGTPRLALTVGSNTRHANYSATGSTATELVFAYPVTATDKDEDGISIVANALALNGGAIHKQGDASANAVLGHGALSAQSGHLVNGVPVIVSDGVEVISDPVAAPGTYGAGETIKIQVTFSEAVNATSETDFVLSVNSRKRAPLLRGNGTATLVFGYTVEAGDADTNGIWIGNQGQTLVGNRSGPAQNGEIKSVATDRAADLRHDSLGRQSGHKVDGSLEVPQVTITADQTAFTALLDDVIFTLSRTGSTAAALTVAVELIQEEQFLPSGNLLPMVTFQAGGGEAALTVHRSLFLEANQDGTLTATVQPGTGYVPGRMDSASTDIRVVPVAVTVHLDRGSYTFDEDDTGAHSTVVVTATTAPGIPSPNSFVQVSMGIQRLGDGPLPGNDFQQSSFDVFFQPSAFSAAGSVYTARKTVRLEPVDDDLDEPEESFTVKLQLAPSTPPVVALRQHDGTACDSEFVCTATATIRDNDEADEITQSAGGATWTLTGERTPAPGDTYTFRIELAPGSGAKPLNEYVGFYLRDSATNQNRLGTDPAACSAPKEFCASFSGESEAAGIWDGTGGHDTIHSLLADTSPHAATATLAVPAHTPVGATITFGPLDRDGNPRPGGMTIIVTEPGGVPNATPVITTISPVMRPENDTAVTTLQAFDVDNDPITWSKTGGADAALFNIDRMTGELTFQSAPDYENPADAASTNPANGADNNEYVVFVTASDGTASTELRLVVRVTNANDAPTGTVTIGDTSPMIGDVLTASAAAVADQDGLPDPFAPAWQWYRTPTDGSETEIDRATAATYTVVRADYGATLTAKATWTDNGGFTNTLASAATDETPRPSCTQNPGDVWCGVVTVEWYEPLSGDGYAPAFGSNPQVGDLSNKNFAFRGMPYTIDLILVERKTGDSFFEGVYFSLDRALPRNARDALVLYIGPTSRPPSTPSGDTSLSFQPFSRVDYASNTYTYRWLGDKRSEGGGPGDPGFVEHGPGVDWSNQTTVTVRLRENAPPVFMSAGPFTVDENKTTVGTVTATDADPGDTYLRYAITGGADRYESDGTTERFEIDAESGALSFKSAPNHEDPQDDGADNVYEVEVEARSGTDTKATAERGITNRTRQTITVTVLNVPEQPAKPAKPTLAAVANSTTSLRVNWMKPDLNGGPEITGYNVAYREYATGTDGDWTALSHSDTDTAVTAIITGLNTDTEYEARVQAENGETPSDWSEPSDPFSPKSCALNPGDLWCGVVTVAGVLGNTAHGFMLGDGDLDGNPEDKMFLNYTINSAFVGTTGNLDVILDGALSDDDWATLALHVEGHSEPFAFSAASTQSGVSAYTWEGSGLDWSSASTVTLRLRRKAAPMLRIADARADEGDAVAFTVTLSEAVAGDVTVAWTASRETDDTAESDDFDDLSAATGTLTIDASEMAATFTVATAQDDDEDDETFTVTLSNPSPSGVQLANATATGMIRDDDGRPEVTITATPDTATEGTDAVFTLSRTGSTAAALTVTVEVSDPEDVLTTTSPPSSVTFEAGSADATLTLATDDDDTDGADGTVTVELQAGTGYEVGTPASATVTITDDDNAAPEITTTSPVKTPENTTAAATLEATDADTIEWSKTGGADQGLFSIDSSSGELTFDAAPDYEDPADAASDDPVNNAENNEYVVFVTASDGTASTELRLVVQVTNADEGQSGTVTIDDTTPMVGDVLTASAAAVADPDGLPDSFAPSWQWYRTPDGGNETEITGATATAYTVVAADLGAALTAKASWTDKGGFPNTLASDPTAAVTAPEVTIKVADDDTVTEGTNAVFTLSRTGSATSALTVAVAVSQTEAVLTTSPLPSSVTFAAGSAAATLTLATDDDYTDGDDGTVTVTLQAGSGYEVGTPASAEVAVTDNDVPVDLVLSVPATVAEDEGPLTVTVTATTAENAPPPPETSVPFFLKRFPGQGTATSGTDHDAVSEAVYLQPGQFDAATVDGQPRYRAVWTHDVTIVNDDEVEADETLVLQMERQPGLPAIHTLEGGEGPVQATVTIEEDDPPVGFTADPTPNQVVLTWGHGNVATNLTGHEYRRRTGTAGAWGEWTPIPASGTDGVNFQSHTVSGLGTEVTYGFELRAVDDQAKGVVASAEATTFVPMSVTLCCNSPTTFNLDERLRLTFEFSHRVNQLAYFDNPVDYKGVFVAAGSAPPDPKWGRNPDAGERDRFFNLDVSPNADTITVTLEESPTPRTRCTASDRRDKDRFCSTDNLPLGESLVVTLVRATPQNDATLSALVVNDGTSDVALSPIFASAVTSYTASVANDVDEVTVTPTKGNDAATVAWLDASDNELADADDMEDGQQVALAVGANVIKVQVTAADGTATQTYTVTVRRAAALPELSVEAAEAAEGNAVEFTVTLTKAAATDVTVNWAASLVEGVDTAETGDFTDLSAATGTLTFSADTSQTTATFTVATVSDTTDEDDETFTVTLSGVSSNAQISDATAQGTIKDDDGLPMLSVDDVSAEEGEGLTFTVTLSPESGREVSVSYATSETSPQSAVSGADFTAVSATRLVIPAGTTQKTFTVTTNDDATAELAETFTVTLSGPTNAEISDATGTGTITDNDGTANAAPVFTSDAEFDAAENQTSAGTVLATDGDTEDSIEGYAITGGTDQAFFSIGATSGALTFDDAPNFEDAEDQGTDNTYVVTVQATSGTGERVRTATQTITVTVTDVSGEAPGKPDAPTVSAASATSLTVSWSAPTNAGPAITDYDYRYRTTSPQGTWTEVTGTTITALSATIGSLAETTSYDVQVRATNAEGTGDWSDAGSGATDANAAPAFSSSATFDAAENQTAAGTVLAADSDTGDDITGYAITGGADQAFFSVGATDGALTFDAAPNFEDAKDADTDNDYVVTVQATSGTGTREKTATQTITVAVTDVAGEAPGKPEAPTVASASATSLTVNWSAPDNAGPAITDYDVQYREGTSGDWSDGGHTGTAVTATLTGLSEDTAYQVQVRATNDEGTGSWSDSGSGTTDANAAPTFSSSATISVDENETAVVTVAATDGDAGDDITGYTITGGADQTLFSIGAISGALTFNAAPNFEDAQDADTDNDYVVTVQATSGTGTREKTADQTITVTVNDVSGEAPGKPEAPTVASASATSLTVNWSAPDNAGPAITDYDVQYREGTSGDWSDGGHTGTAVTATLTGLSEDTAYQVQVRATNDEGTGSWSDSGSGTTDANAAPTFSSSATISVDENETAVVTVAATDGDAGDDITGYTITGGADQTLFSIDGTSGALTFKTAPNFEDAQDADTDNDYVVTVQATSGTGTREKTATQTITVTVTDVAGEAPGKPEAPTVASASATSLTVNWSAPDNAGPAITDYDVQYREGTSGDWSDGGHTGTAVTATLTGLSEDTAYQVQVRATNNEGTGSWSDSGSGTTDANAAPSFSSSATFDAAENQTAAGTVLAADSDAGDDITGYAITGGADQTLFSIGATSGALTFNAAPNFEDAKDSDTDNDYVVEVQATSGTGTREKTATQTITVTVTDVAGEAPGKPAAPTVSAASATSLTVNWSVPANAGPAITDYDYRYRTTSPQGTWTEVTGTTITALSATIGSLAETTSYDVQVRATNAEGTGSWSDAGSGATDANAAPTFSSSATISVDENETAVVTVEATDGDTDDDVTGYAITGGADQTFFSIGATSGALTFDAAPNFEDAKDSDTDNDYVVEVQATSGTGTREKTATQTITVTVTDVAGEAPGKPDAPDVAPASVTSLTVTWTAPANAGPAITDYDVQYRAGTTGNWTDGGHTGAAVTATLSGLSENTSYQVQVRATNDEGTGSWSDAGTGTTDANAAPTFSSSATFDAAENQTSAGTVLAADSDSDDDITGYAITGGTDQAFFSIGATSGALTFDDAPNFEDAEDQGTDNTYVVTVQATSGTGTRVRTATQTITVTVTDVAGEAPGKPAAPTVSAASATSLTVNWSAPTNAGPAIDDYDYRYRTTSPQGTWTEVTGTTITALSATIGSLAETTSYDVQVRATNAEGTGDWSDSGSGATDANAAPTFSSSATISVDENETAVVTVEATDGDTDDDVTGYAITGGADQTFFSIGATSGALTFNAAPNFEDAKDSDTDNDYVVEVQATSGTGTREKTATQTITVTVTDVAGEAPGKPDAPTVAAASVTSLTVNWSAPANAGPAITDYDVQYREGTTGDWSDGNHTGTAVTATLSGLSENTSYQVQVRATNDEGTGSWSDAGTGTTDANAAPTFSSSATFDAAENQTAAGTVLATDGDTGDDITGYAITGGTDQAFFSIGATSGALTFDDAPNFEDAEDQGTDNTYVVTVQATSGTGTRVRTATQTITVTVTDVAGEAPGKPDAPTVAAASVTSLTVNWSAPANAGPAITDYDVQYREGTTGDWSDGNHTGTATTATLSGLSEDTSYQVRVRATNDEGTGSWSDAGSGTTDANAAPAFSSSATFDAAENQTAAGTVLATDGDTGDDITGYAITGGADQTFFSIGATSGVLTFKTAPNFEDAKDSDTDNDYVVTVQATSGTGTREKTATQTITVTVTDVAGEAPGKPDAPDVAPASVTSLTVNWSAPANAGPAITDYDVQYRAGTTGNWTDGGHTGAAVTATLSGLSENTSYQVQVRATNDEGTGSWSDSGSGTTDANAAPTFSSSATFDAAENQTAAGTVLATDGDTGDDITGYAITGGADQTFFSIGATSGVLTFKTAPNFEDAKDADTDNDYVVTVQATSGTGERVRTATQAITVTVTDADEKSAKPAKPTLEAVTGSSTTLVASWTKPGLNGGPEIAGYDVQYKVSTESSWSAFAHTDEAIATTITGLTADTSYQVRVRAKNGETDSDWSDPLGRGEDQRGDDHPDLHAEPRRPLVRSPDGRDEYLEWNHVLRL